MARAVNQSAESEWGGGGDEEATSTSFGAMEGNKEHTLE